MKFSIEVIIEDFLPRSFADISTPGNYKIYVSKDELRDLYRGDDSIPAAIMHELGHVLGSQFHLINHEKIIQQSGSNMPEDFMNRENEAWQVAEKLFAEVKQLALNSHRQYWYPTDVFNDNMKNMKNKA
jgi:hypothetical protein